MTCCNKNCNQGRDCSVRKANGHGMPIDMYEPGAHVDDVFTAVWLCVLMILVVAIIGIFAGIAYGFYF